MQIIIDGKEYEATPMVQPSKEKDWGIVSYGYAQNNEGKPEQQYIHSVRRLSDNEIFSVGDELDGTGYSNCKISSIVLYKDAPYPVLKYNDDKCSVSICGGLKKLPSIKPSEQPSKERIEVLNFNQKVGAPKSRYEVRIGSGQTIPEEKFPLIKQAIENILNDDRKPYHYDQTIPAKYPDLPFYTQEQLDKAIEDAFYSRCETLEDYLSSFKKQ